jgi:hypothetical protein
MCKKAISLPDIESQIQVSVEFLMGFSQPDPSWDFWSHDTTIECFHLRASPKPQPQHQQACAGAGMNGLYRLALRILTVMLIILPVGLWVWTAMSVSLVCALDESSSACADPNAGMDALGFLKLAIVPWALAALCSNIGKRLDLRLKEER